MKRACTLKFTTLSYINSSNCNCTFNSTNSLLYYNRIFFLEFVSKVPAFLNVVDIAGLVKGASEGQGLGNAFLSHISACDALFHLCRKNVKN